MGDYMETPCQNCGKSVTISVPFVGCVFCGDCVTNDSGQYDGTEDFHDERREYWPFLEKPVIRTIEKEHLFFNNIRDTIRALRSN